MAGSMTSKQKRLLVTGSTGLIGSSVCYAFADAGWEIHGIDNNGRADFFGSEGDTSNTRQGLHTRLLVYEHYHIDVRDRDAVMCGIEQIAPHAIVHAAGQPSHDLAARIPFLDFDTNAVGTLNVLEAARSFAPEAPFLFLSTNKVYGDSPNRLRMKEYPARYELDDADFPEGIHEGLSIDQSLHSLFGASKTSADILVQEYGKYFHMPTMILRCGCITGPEQAGVQLHGFLNYLVKCYVSGQAYTVFGYQGKQVRDNLHAADLAALMLEMVQSPKVGEVYNVGGGKENSCSLQEVFSFLESTTGRPMLWSYSPEARIGDHQCYYSDLRKIRRDFPQWQIGFRLSDILSDLLSSWTTKLEKHSCPSNIL